MAFFFEESFPFFGSSPISYLIFGAPKADVFPA
jgi:hypothetical protein